MPSGTIPPTKTVDASDTYFGKTYNDPYRWLENLKDMDVEAWFKARAELTDGHFTEEKIVTFKNFAGQYAFLLWQTGHKDFQPVKWVNRNNAVVPHADGIAIPELIWLNGCGQFVVCIQNAAETSA